MQSASHRGLLDIEYIPTRREKMWESAREWMGGGRLVAGILVLLLTISIAKSTATAAWVPGIDAIVTIAVIAALLMGVLATVPIPEALGLGVGLVLAPVGAVWAAWPQLHAQQSGPAKIREIVARDFRPVEFTDDVQVPKTREWRALVEQRVRVRAKANQR